MTTSEKVDQLVRAYFRFQDKLRPLKKKGIAQRDGEFYTYAPINDILRHVRKPLAAQGLYVIQLVTGDIGVTTWLVWSPPKAEDPITFKGVPLTFDGDQWIESTAVVTVKGTMEEKGAAITQLRRYSLITLLGLPTVDAAPVQSSAGSFAQEIVKLRQQNAELVR